VPGDEFKQVQQPRLLDLNSVAADLESMFERILGEDIETEIRPARDLGLAITTKPGVRGPEPGTRRDA
jgi:hypothetical protein